MRLVILFLTIIIFSTNSYSQYNTIASKVDTPAKSTRAQVVYGEFLGSGLIFSTHYDFRFGKRQNGFGMRAGLGFFGGSNSGILTVPVGINHLAGNGPHYFESGLGFTLASFTGSTDFLDGGGSFLVPSVGYRYQPLAKGFVARVYVSPLVLVNEGGGWFFWGGFSLGYKIR